MNVFYIYGPEFDKNVGNSVYRLFADVYCLHDLHLYLQQFNLPGGNFLKGKLIDYYWIAENDPLVETFKADPHITIADKNTVALLSRNYKDHRDMMGFYAVELYPKKLLLSCQPHEYKKCVKELKIHPMRLVQLRNETDQKSIETLANIHHYGGIIVASMTTECKFMIDDAMGGLLTTSLHRALGYIKDFDKKYPHVKLKDKLQRGVQ